MSTTTTRGYRVPTLDDPIDASGTNPFEAFKNLADDIDADMTASAGVSILDRAAAVTQIVNTAAETDLYRKTIAGGLLGSDGGLRLSLCGDLLNNSGGSIAYRFKVKFGATTIFDTGATTSMVQINPNASRGFWLLDVQLLNSAAAAQDLRTRLEVVSGASATGMTGGQQQSLYQIGAGLSTEDTALAKDLAITITMASAAATIDIRRHIALLEKVSHS